MAGAVVLSLIVVAASFTLSFNALADLARMSGAIPDSLTPLLPVVIDMFILQATWCVYVATRRGDDAGKRYHFAMLAIFSTVSVAGNATHAFLASGQGTVHGATGGRDRRGRTAGPAGEHPRSCHARLDRHRTRRRAQDACGH